MINKTLLSLAFLLYVLVASSQPKISPYTQSFLRNHSPEQIAKTAVTPEESRYAKTVTQGNTTLVDAFITLHPEASTSTVIAEGAMIYTRVGDILTAQIPIDKIVTISELEAVKRISVARPIRLKNDKSRVSSQVSPAHIGTGLKQPYTGKGVIVGGVDTGIDVNHIAFTDETGQSRVKRVYFPSDRRGTPPSDNGFGNKPLSGSEYTTAAEIAALTTDTRGESHGTHTFGISAGGYMGNGLYGMAPEADIVMVGTPQLTDVNIANGVAYTFDYANQEDKPAVVNLSLGKNDGPHDGTSELNRYFDHLSQKGNIIVISAGNEGGDRLYIGKTFSSPVDELKTFLIDYKEGSRLFQGSVDTWSKTATAVGVKVVVYSTSSQSVVYESKVFKPGSTGGFFEISSERDSKFAKYYQGYVYLSSRVEYNGRYNVWCEFEANIPTYNATNAQPAYRLGLVYTSEAGNSIDIWADDFRTYLSDQGITGWTDGNSSCSINDFTTTNSVISVGAYAARNSYTTISGHTATSDGVIVDDIILFSSYGVDFNGIARPDVTAPGVFVLSAVNSYDPATVTEDHDKLAAEITAGGRKHQWGNMSGTSMSCPTVAGIIALWLQANPNLNVENIREILNVTSVKDSYVTQGNPLRWGAGKIDAYTGLVRCITLGTDQPLVENNAVIIYPNPSDGHFKLFAQGETSTMTLSVYAADGTWVASQTIKPTHNETDVDLSSTLTTGLYFVQLIGEKTNHTSRILIK